MCYLKRFLSDSYGDNHYGRQLLFSPWGERPSVTISRCIPSNVIRVILIYTPTFINLTFHAYRIIYLTIRTVKIHIILAHAALPVFPLTKQMSIKKDSELGWGFVLRQWRYISIHLHTAIQLRPVSVTIAATPSVVNL